MQWFGYTGKILEVDLTERKLNKRDMQEDEALRFMGGAGLNAWTLYNSCKPGTSALGPDNPLIFGVGPLVGTEYPSAARSTFTSLSPLTGIFGDSNGGGFFGARVKQSGYDQIVIRGIADSPCCLALGPGGKATIEDASDLWGKDTIETEEMLRKKYPGCQVACIGPAGENLVGYANIMGHHSTSYGRTGMGAVMGSKKLKAIVAYGSDKIPVKDPNAFKSLSDEVRKWVKESPSAQVFSQTATSVLISVYASLGFVYKYNGRKKVVAEDGDQIDYSKFLAAADVKQHGCWMCPIKCIKAWRIKEGPYKDEKGYKYEVGHAYSFGFNLGVNDVSSIMHLMNVCNRLGMDAIEFSGVLGMAIDVHQQGILDKGPLEGIILEWANPELIEELARKTACGEGFGKILALGSKKAAATIGGGADKHEGSIKGLVMGKYDSPAYMCALSVSTRGGDHLKGMPNICMNPENREVAEKLFGGTAETVNLYSNNDKGRAVWWNENYKMIIDSLGICYFMSQCLIPHGFLFPEHIADGFRAATGFEMDGDDLLKAGERTYQLEKAFNARLGISRKDDYFPKRPEKDSDPQNIDLDQPGLLDEYYRYRGCSQDGLPTKARLDEVGLAQIADDLEAEGRMGTDFTE